MMTTQILNYNSLNWDPLTSRADAFAQMDWSLSNNNVNARFGLLARILDIVIKQQATATVIAPMWPAQIWFQKLTSLLIENPIPLPVSPRPVICVGPRAEPLKKRAWRLYAWRISGRRALDAMVGLNVPLLNQCSVSLNPL